MDGHTGSLDLFSELAATREREQMDAKTSLDKSGEELRQVPLCPADVHAPDDEQYRGA
jgi:hypothetical protein